MAAKPSHNTLIHCDACGEDYSATYRRCPFCGARNDPRHAAREMPPPVQREEEDIDDGYVFDGQDAFDEEPEEEYYPAPRPKGGKRLAPKQGGDFELPPVNWPRLITFLCSLVIIVAALIIVFTWVYPQLHGSDAPKPEDSAEVSAQPSAAPSAPPSQPGAADPTPALSDDLTLASGEPIADVTPPPAQSASGGAVLTGIILKNSDGQQVSDITIPVGSGAQLTAEFTPAGWSGPVTWTSTNPEWVKVSENGYVSNVNNTGAFHNVYITAAAGGVSVQCIVRALAGDKPVQTAAPSAPPASQAPGGTGGPAVGRPGTIVNADGGLRVRPDPSTSNPPIATLRNGDPINVVAAADNGWYQISFAGSGGATMTGYIMGEYISGN